MSSYTTNLQLFKYNTATDGKQVFSIDDAMNDNWDKIDAFAKAIKDLSNLSSVGEKRFTDINNELSQKLEAQVSLAQNGYIKFNNGIIICWGRTVTTATSAIITLPISFLNTYRVLCNDNGSGCVGRGASMKSINTFTLFCVRSESTGCNYLCIGF